MRQLPLPVQLRSSSVFASFYRGANAAVVDQLMSLESNRRQVSVWLCGASGVGKTHLLQAVCAQAGLRGLSAAYIPLADPTVVPEMLNGCESLDLICLDDIDRIARQAVWERAVFRLYTELEDSGGRLLIGACSPPAAVNIELQDLASRLAISTILRLESLDDDDLTAALKFRATQLGVDLPADVAQFLLRRLPRDMARLCDVLDRLDRDSLATQRRLTVPFVRAAIDEWQAQQPENNGGTNAI